MNDWLTYKGSGSSRAVIAHAAYKPNTKPIAQQAANSVRGKEYDILNAELDRLYTQAQDLVSVQKKTSSSLVSFINSAHRIKADLVIIQAKIAKFNDSYNSINKRINSYGGTELQKTALNNKVNSIWTKAHTSLNSMSRLGTDVGVDTINNLIDDINNRTV